VDRGRGRGQGSRKGGGKGGRGEGREERGEGGREVPRYMICENIGGPCHGGESISIDVALSEAQQRDAYKEQM